MFKEGSQLKWAIISIFIFVVIALIGSTSVQAAYWTALPPYNVLWPLWSPALSPVNPLTGQPVPLLTHLDRNTILPVQPAIAWDPFLEEPYALYNNPLVYFGGLMYFNTLFGFGNWPPPYMVNSETGFPLPLSLPVGYPFLPPTDLAFLEGFIPAVNSMFSIRSGVPIENLLTAAGIWGL